MLDGNARLNLATFVTTHMEPQAEKLMAESFDKNMIDKDEYPQTAELEMRCVNMLSRLWNSPSTDEATGCSTTGSSEAAMLGGSPSSAAGSKGDARPGEHRAAQHGHGDKRPDLLGEVLQLLRGRAPLRADGGEPFPPQRRGGGQALRREHHRRGRHPRLYLRRLLRAGAGDLGRPRRSAGAHRPRRADPRGRGFGGDGRALYRSRSRLGLPASARGLDQHLGPQVRQGVPWRGLGHLARPGGATGRARLPGELPRWATCPRSSR